MDYLMLVLWMELLTKILLLKSLLITLPNILMLTIGRNILNIKIEDWKLLKFYNHGELILIFWILKFKKSFKLKKILRKLSQLPWNNFMISMKFSLLAQLLILMTEYWGFLIIKPLQIFLSAKLYSSLDLFQ